MSFINRAVVDVRKPLVEARFPFSRAKSLSETMTWCATDYYTVSGGHASLISGLRGVAVG